MVEVLPLASKLMFASGLRPPAGEEPGDRCRMQWLITAPNGDLVRWKLEGEDLIAMTLAKGAQEPQRQKDNERWQEGEGGGQFGGGAVFVGGTKKQNLMPAPAQVACVKVCGQLAAHQIAKVFDPVDIGNCGCNQVAGHGVVLAALATI